MTAESNAVIVFSQREKSNCLLLFVFHKGKSCKPVQSFEVDGGLPSGYTFTTHSWIQHAVSFLLVWPILTHQHSVFWSIRGTRLLEEDDHWSWMLTS